MNDANYTLPVGLTDGIASVPESKILDDHFAHFSNTQDDPERIAERCLALCRHTLELGMTHLPYEYAKAAAHWRKVAERRRQRLAA